jgi:hypothetical protein
MESPLVHRTTQEQLYVKLGLNFGNRAPARSHVSSPSLCLTSVTSAPTGDPTSTPTTGLCVSYTDRKNKFAINIRDVRNLAGTTRLSVTSQNVGRSALAMTPSSMPSASMQQRLEQVANGDSVRMSNLANVSGGKKEVIYFTNGNGSIISLRRILSKGYGEKAAVEAGGLMRGEMVQTDDGSILVMIRRQDAVDAFGQDTISALPQAAEPLALEGRCDHTTSPEFKCRSNGNSSSEATMDDTQSAPHITAFEPESALPSPPVPTPAVPVATAKKRKHRRVAAQPTNTNTARTDADGEDRLVCAPPKRKKQASVSVEDTASVLVGLEQMLASASGGMNEMLGIQMSSSMGFEPIDVDDLTARYMTNSPESVMDDYAYVPPALPTCI